MFCPKCGKETDASGKFCQWCGADIVSIPVTPVATPEEEEVEGPDIGVYAGLGRRFVAFIVDIIIILLFDLVAMAVLGLSRGLQNFYFYFVQQVPVESLTTEGTSAALLDPSLRRMAWSSLSSRGCTLPGSNLPAARQHPENC